MEVPKIRSAGRKAGTRRVYPVHFIDMDAKGAATKDGPVKVEPEIRELALEEIPPRGIRIQLGRIRRRVHEQLWVYGKSGLLRVEVEYTARSLAEISQDALGSMAAERVRKTPGKPPK
jgi:hypothetical protein